MKYHPTKIIETLIGRRNAWRLGRSLYMKAREDSPNIPQLNGEEFLQRQLLARFATTQEELVVFDVGANVGDWTYSLLQESSKLNIESRLEIHSFEPVPSTFAVLQERINRHKLRNTVHLVSQALSSENGTAEMYITGETAGTNSLHPDAMKRSQQRIQITKTNVYDYCLNHNIANIHFLKCDTEGHDMEVINGSKKLFDEQRVMSFQFEYNHRWIYSRYYLKDVFDKFENTDYMVGKVTPNRIEIYQEWHPELERFIEGNYIILHPKAVQWYKTVTGKFDDSNTYCTNRQFQQALP